MTVFVRGGVWRRVAGQMTGHREALCVSDFDEFFEKGVSTVCDDFFSINSGNGTLVAFIADIDTFLYVNIKVWMPFLQALGDFAGTFVFVTQSDFHYGLPLRASPSPHDQGAGGVNTRLARSRSTIIRPWGLSPTSLSWAMMSLSLPSSSICSVTNHCRKICVA